jgi:hypothetical protein
MTPTSRVSEDRAAFEKWVRGHFKYPNLDIDPRYPGFYADKMTAGAWEAWQAAKTTVSDSVAVGDMTLEQALAMAEAHTRLQAKDPYPGGFWSEHVVTIPRDAWDVVRAHLTQAGEDAEQLEWLVAMRGKMQIIGSDDRGWSVCDTSNGLTFASRGHKTYREAIDVARNALKEGL